MAATQELPSWLTVSTSVYTDANGVATTATAVLYLPLTYYGPSIPLGPDWTWGGVSSPASTATETTAVTTDTTSSTAIPSTTSSSSPTSATPSSTSATSATSSNSSSSGSSTSPTSSASSTPTTPAHNGLSTGAIVGLVIAAVAVVMLLVLLCACCYVRRRRRRGETSRRWSMLTPAPGKREKEKSPKESLTGDYYMVGAEDTEGASDTVRTPGEGSPRHSGEEADPFLRPRSGGIATDAGSMREFGQPATRTKMTDSSGSSNWQTTQSSSGPSTYATGSSGLGSLGLSSSGPGSSGNNTRSTRSSSKPGSKMTSSSGTTDYGVTLEEPTLFRGQRQNYNQDYRGSILSPEQQRELDEATSSAPSTPYKQPAIPESDNEADFSPLMPPPRLVDPEFGRTRSSSPLDRDEPVVVQTAQRVRMSDVGPRMPRSHSPILEVDETEHMTPPPSRRISGQSWLGSLASGIGLSRLLKGSTSYKDPEAGRSLLGSPEMSERLAQPRPAMAGAGSSRPISGTSVHTTGSGSTVFFDATSKPGTPALPAPPRAFTPGQEARATPPPSADKPIQSQPNTTVRRVTSDILDQPPPLSTFTSASSMRDTVHTDSTDATKVPSFPPPGLALLPASARWGDDTPSLASIGGQYHDLDVLEEEPPVADAQWRQLAETLPQGRGPRTTFGMPTYIHASGMTSEQASLYSMRSHIEPNMTRSTGSAPASSIGSSHPSRHKGSGSVSGSSLAHSASITSDGRRRHPTGPTSPVLSAFGDHSRGATGSSGGTGSSHAQGSSSSHGHGSSSHQHNGSSSQGHYDNNYLSPDRALSDEGAQLFRSNSMPWAGGLPVDWHPTGNSTESDPHNAT
ncbi:uncharacterized protein SCHCODRAFT_02623659 [Schizophyllum commune H4-8]|uniref:Expressed protein n=1 Tax=Schizophyllum commune (strain H4-8 / FGSC 9210) TaxID=578458 RepID=D8PK13_SCHCM|nr:uncharacterized protein SCHCODRAFT_02623659 [Schizophyllum commune H4-8]KAI5894077.1 hypothetical protein SCHCODRAFT_02623659 [Schizophyllum commune H4-8]